MFVSLSKVGISTALFGAATALSLGVPIIGEVNLSGLGPVTLINNVGPAGAANPNNADAIHFAAGNNTFVVAAAGTFAGMEGAFGHMSDFAFNPMLAPVAPLWLLSNGFSFNLTTFSLVDQATPDFLNLVGTGSFAGPAGFETTSGTWAMSIATQGTLFTWTSANLANTPDSETPGIGVPDAGSTALLLVLGLLSLAAAHRLVAEQGRTIRLVR
jgi:hypothetical protein